MKTGYKVSDVMTLKPIILDPEENLMKCAQQMKEHHVGAILVNNKEEVLGILTEQDIVRKVIGAGVNPLDIKIKDVMERNLAVISPNSDIFEGLLKMREMNIKHLPVIDNKRMVGLLTIKDILKLQPQLFELIVDKFEVKESHRKPIEEDNEGVCQQCGETSIDLHHFDGISYCQSCLKKK